MAHLYDAHGHIIHDPDEDGYHTDEEVNDLVEGIKDIPPADKTTYFNALLLHWQHIHYGDPGTHDNLRLKQRTDGLLDVLTYWRYWDDRGSPHEGLEYANLDDNPYDI